jgi:release factor glutamine methyltransferase
MAERLVDEETAGHYWRLLFRRTKMEPLQYLTGWEEFYGIRLAVRPGVFIPRPETECLVEWAIELLKQQKGCATLHAADLGTGSGAIAIALAQAFPTLTVYAAERSQDTLIVAQENSRHSNVGRQVQFFCGDLFEPMALPAGLLDLVIANPPYIPSGEIADLPVEVREHEPRLALDGGGDGMALHRRIFAASARFLKPGGWLLMEMGLGQARLLLEEAQRILEYEALTIKRDLCGIERMIGARRV